QGGQGRLREGLPHPPGGGRQGAEGQAGREGAVAYRAEGGPPEGPRRPRRRGPAGRAVPAERQGRGPQAGRRGTGEEEGPRPGRGREGQASLDGRRRGGGEGAAGGGAGQGVAGAEGVAGAGQALLRRQGFRQGGGSVRTRTQGRAV